MPVVIGVTVSSYLLIFCVMANRFTLYFTPAKDYVEGMWLMLQQPTPDDFVLATGETHKVREFVNKSFKALGIHLKYVLPLPFRIFCPLII